MSDHSPWSYWPLSPEFPQPSVLKKVIHLGAGTHHGLRDQTWSLFFSLWQALFEPQELWCRQLPSHTPNILPIPLHSHCPLEPAQGWFRCQALFHDLNLLSQLPHLPSVQVDLALPSSLNALGLHGIYGYATPSSQNKMLLNPVHINDLWMVLFAGLEALRQRKHPCMEGFTQSVFRCLNPSKPNHFHVWRSQGLLLHTRGFDFE